jgi:hypothetical protein
MFFEAVPAPAEPAWRWPPETPPWLGPPGLEAGVLLAAGRVIARSQHVAVFLPAIRVFSTGCLLDMEIVSRQAGLADDEWWDLHMSVHRRSHGFGGPGLPDKLLRLGVRFPDDGKATTLDHCRSGKDDSPPEGPVLSWWPGSSGMRDRGELGFSHFGLWLWPIPPAGPFDFAVEWPFGGITETLVELDGAAIAVAAAHPAYYWPDAPVGTA